MNLGIFNNEVLSKEVSALIIIDEDFARRTTDFDRKFEAILRGKRLPQSLNI